MLRSSNLQPLTSEETRKVADHIWRALEAIPKHRHNKGGNADYCDTCVAYQNLIAAFRVFKRFGE